MGTPILMLGAVATIVVVLDIWATSTVSRQIEIPSSQRRAQVCFIWLLPVIGALVAVEVHRRTAYRRPRARLVADEIHPLIGQAAGPIADLETRTAEHYIETQLIDFVQDIGGHGHADSGH